ncbi:MAG: fasciclin domain-containing protein [Brevundimonas sp.]|nr:MAG: fasciclin domain-containing protein [Brevundimonas sp.]
MPRLQLLTATAAAALLASPTFAQTAPTPPAPTPVPVTSATPATPSTAAPDVPVPAAEPADDDAPAPAAQVPVAPPAQAVAATPAAAGDVIQVLTAQGNFTTLLAALNQAQLTDILKSRPKVTIFAPTDEAFAALPEAERARLMDPANAQELRNLLLYHVIVADVSSSQITGAKGGVQTANRTRVLLDGTGEGLHVDGATVTRADIDASNGAVFAIDKVLNPAQSMAPPETPAPAAPAAAGATATAHPAAPGTTAPNGQPAATTTTVASPPVHNPTDGQVDSRPDPARAAPAAAPSAAPATMPAPAAAPAPSATTHPATPGTTAPNGQPAATTTTVASPPVPNPTDGQVDRPGTPRN